MDVDPRPEEHDEDQDSLFGSPPPSPQITGRPASPSLALPSSGGSGSRLSISTAPATQNVGTIALPGSHHVSELAINPLALSLSHGVVHRPPADLRRASVSTLTAYQPSVQENPTMSSSHITVIGSKPRPKAKNKSRQSSRSSTSELTQPQGPEFSLPDPSAPLPVNFLRNQENLLGRAGLVGGVKPAVLTHTNSNTQPYTPGSTPSNPILVDEEDDTPILGRRTRSKEQPYIDSALLTAPTNQEIVSVLIGQKDIFPILEGVLKLVMRSATGGAVTTESESSAKSTNNRSKPTFSDSSSPQPVKKRKLNRVPAGATDWDVPYPFPDGEGPDAYRKTWERERGKQLISQLIKLIKSAARKAATKKYLQQQRTGEEVKHRTGKEAASPRWEATRRVNGHYRPETASYGTTTGQPTQTKSQVLQDASNASRTSRSSDSDPTASNFAPSTSTQSVDTIQSSAMTAFNELHASIDPLAQGQVSSEDIMSQSGFDDISGSRPNPTFSTPTDAPSFGPGQSMFDTWMNFLEQFPMPFGGLSDSFTALSSEPASHSSTPGLDEFNLMGMMGGNPNPDPSIVSSEFDAMMTSMLGQPHMPGNDESMMSNNAVFSLFGDSALDENIFPSTSGPAGGIVDGNLGVIDPGFQAASPIASTSSVGTNEPVTPVATNWNFAVPDVTIGGAESNADAQGWDGGNDISMNSLPDFGILPEAVGKEIPNTVDKGKGRAVDPPTNTLPLLSTEPPLPPPRPATTAQTIFQAMLDPKLKMYIPPPPPLVPPTSRKLRKGAILQRAQEKRRMVQEELDKIKMQLWETTIEQAGLVQLVKQLDEVERSKIVES